MIFPTREDIVNLNLRHIMETGGERIGIDNSRNIESLEWVLEAIQDPLFSTDLYPSIESKAAILAWTIIDGHVFNDGCKRTGISALEIFLITNGYNLNATGFELIEIALKIAKRVEEPYTLEEFIMWLRSRIQQDNNKFYSLTTLLCFV